jgi:hypothetical protein
MMDMMVAVDRPTMAIEAPPLFPISIIMSLSLLLPKAYLDEVTEVDLSSMRVIIIIIINLITAEETKEEFCFQHQMLPIRWAMLLPLDLQPLWEEYHGDLIQFILHVIILIIIVAGTRPPRQAEQR